MSRGTRGAGPIRRLVLGAGMVAALALPGGAAADEGDSTLGLFQLLARADLVVRARVKEGSLKYALVDVIEPIKGQPPAQRLRISFRDFNWHRHHGTDPIVFVNGGEEILFLTPFNQANPKPKNRDLFELFRGVEGRISLPAEGAATTVGNLKRLAALTGIDPAAQLEGLWALLQDADPRLQEVALDELLRLRAPAVTRLGSLQGLLRSPAPALRDRALRLIASAFASREGLLRPEAAADDLRSALESVLERARNDPEEAVRTTAVRAMAVWPRRSDVEGDLRAIAGQDSAQMVRYEAQRALLSVPSR